MKAALCLLIVSASTLAAEPRVHRNLPYDEPQKERHSLDVYAPAEGKGHPIVFWIHGGGWQRGDKGDVQVKPQALVDKGFVFVSTNYRFVPNVTIRRYPCGRRSPSSLRASSMFSANGTIPLR